MQQEKRDSYSGFCLTELIIASAAAAILLLGIGTVLVHMHHNWANTYEQVNGQTTSDAFAAKRAFESVVRQSSVSLRPPALSSTGDFIEMYLYRDIQSNAIDSYARFYVEDEKLVVLYGQLSDSSYEEVVAAEAGAVQTASSAKDAFMTSSSSLTGTVLETENVSQTISSKQAVEFMGDGAFADLLSQAVDETTALKTSGNESLSMSSSDCSSRVTSGENKYAKSLKQVLANNVKSVDFSVHGATVRMILTVDENSETKKIMASALRHSG